MSSATTNHVPAATENRSIVTGPLDRLRHGVRAAAFWTATVLPIVLLAAIAAGAAGQHPIALAGALAINAACAVVGHGHALDREQ
jgi:hypothetical protein